MRQSSSLSATALTLRGAESRQPSLGYLHVLAVMATADADPADHRLAGLDRIPAAEHDQAVDPWGRAHGQRRVVLDEVVPGVGGQAEADRGVSLVLGHLDGHQGCAIHAA